jgi:tRNA A-37 threonylcarbamoyl transferase component Bud32
MEPQSVEAVCNLLGRSRLLNPDQIRTLHQRWRAEAKNADDVAAFGQWLVAREYLTEFQAGLVLRGRVDHFFFGPYKILERVGKGRMAGVYSAVHALGQPVAIKVLPPSKSKVPELLARFQREARLAMKLKHPNVVRTFQTGQNDDLHYIVMEYLDGETLEDVLKRRGKLPPAEAARLTHQALLGLQHLHEQGMIHRDIKPGNLMLLGGTSASTMAATVKLMDIGLGKALFDEGAPAPPGGRFELTNEGSLLGTPEYMAPEQARNATSTDIRADIYSLGCVLYHTLAGQVPFPETNLVRQLMRHASEAARPLREFSPAVPEGLQQIVEWMMAKDPGNRYPTPERAAQALQMFLAAGGSAGTTQPEGRMRAYLDWLDKQPGAAATAVPTVAPVPEIELVPVDEQPKRAAPAAKKRKPEPAAPAPRKKRPAPQDAEDEGPKEPRTLSRRDLMLLGLGGGAVVGGLILVGAMAWLLNRLLRPKGDDSPPPATEPEAPPPEAE